jgi:hypothetical protein
LANFACGFTLAHDILWSASARRRPSLTADVESIANLNNISIDIQQATGCESWIFQRIADITMLRIWKSDARVAQSLDVMELAGTATALETQIDSQEKETIQRLEAATDKQLLSMTRIYVAAAKLYLHTTVSEARLDVSAIRERVDATVHALKNLQNATLIRRLSWPICVAASLAETRHEKYFRRLEDGAQGDRDYCTTVLRAFIVARETKRLRRSSPSPVDTFDWMDGLESLGHEWVMI